MDSPQAVPPLPTTTAACLSTKSSPPPTLDTGQPQPPSSSSPSTLPPAPPTPGSEDAETFTGKIVYNPDGSAYIIEGSDGSDVESEVGAMLPLNQEGSIVDRAGPGSSTTGTSSCSPPASGSATASASAIPQVVSAFHIQRSSTAALQSIYSALGNAALAVTANQLLQEKVPEVPIMHSYRVFTLRDKDGAPAAAAAGRSLSSDSSEGDANNNLDQGEDSAEAGSSSATVPVKPILMCFICKISFGYAKSFVAHATTEHRLTLFDDERRLLAQKNTSAIIQGVGKEKEPLLSFLEPKNKAPQPLLPQSLAGLQANLANQLAASAAMTSPTASTPSSALQKQFQQQLEAAVSAQQRLMAAFQRGNPQSSVSSSSAAGDGHRESPSRPSSNGSLNLVLPKSGDDDEAKSNRGTPACEDNSLTPELADLANLEQIAKAAAAAIQQSQEMQENPLALTQNASVAMAAAFVSPKGPQGITFGCPQHPDGKTNGVECPKCDLMLGSSRSLGGHMTMMHSRNSCKTLKCPKCNWHYKYQETLEIHMKEKHPENEMNCIYCLTNQAHPRLARGETYTCGYKPYRCEVCNYSTTTKGNLSIHMQSDKHINNVQELQNGNIPADHILQSQALAQAAAAGMGKATPQPGANQTPGIGSNASSPGAPVDKASPVAVPGSTAGPPNTPVSGNQAKPKATWRCDVCNYETNVARNLRIHMTSEKHTREYSANAFAIKHC